jgi:hypothetical protein
MLGTHEGISPLQDKDAAAGVMLKVMGRLKAGKDVAQRRSIIRQALSRVLPDDRHWMETLVAGLTGEPGIEAIPAHVAALAAGWSADEDAVAAIIRYVNGQEDDPYTRRTVISLSSAAPEFGRRLQAGRIDSDEVFLRVALSHLFQRNPESTFDMFAIDGAVRVLARGMSQDVQSFVKLCLEKYDDSDVPDDAWGYVVVLFDLRGRSGYYIRKPTDGMRENLETVKSGIEKFLGPLSDRALAQHAAVSFIQGYLRAGKKEYFSSAIAPVLELLGHRCIVVYVREQDQGTTSEITVIPTDSPVEARRIVNNIPMVSTYDDFRRMVEMNEQLHERDDIPDDA